LHGYPDEFSIPVSDTQAYKQFANSVAVPAVKATATLILETLLAQAKDSRISPTA
ncbi:MAG: DNA cytosine methyltransferase, partial [Verrucomicrobia bacterium]|nr:DNA cytosine methyltransferase [Verrucomicrobiota bacterium]